MKIVDFAEKKFKIENKDDLALQEVEARVIDSQVAYLEDLIEKVLEGEVDGLVVVSSYFDKPPQFAVLDEGVEPAHTLLSIEACYEYYKDFFAYPSVFPNYTPYDLGEDYDE